MAGLLPERPRGLLASALYDAELLRSAQRDGYLLTWARPPAIWFQLDALLCSKISALGVYIIWRNGRWIRVGQGDIGDRLSDHQNDPEITAHRQFGTLYATWATAPAVLMDGIERYLAEQIQPAVGQRFPDVPPVRVNLPA
ncbi:hypothetical protein [Thalassobaculum sp.]|uniref:hypothetical protein n=1 Tax=Thalassobaculum sp. TaxID=2022740 RepID=UPI0032EA9674